MDRSRNRKIGLLIIGIGSIGITVFFYYLVNVSAFKIALSTIEKIDPKGVVYWHNSFAALRLLNLMQLATMALSAFSFGLYFAERWKTKNS